MSEKRLTEADKKAAQNLTTLWNEYQAKRLQAGQRKLSQEKAGQEMGGMTQGAVSQYLLGKTPLGTEATLKWAQLLGVDPREIRSDFVYDMRDPEKPQFVPDPETIAEENALQFADEFERRLGKRLSPKDKRELFTRIKTRYLRQLNTGQRIPRNKKELEIEVIDFLEVYRLQRGKVKD